MAGSKDAVCFVVHSPESNIVSYTYRLWAQGSSFYFKARNVGTGVKVSLHGPDPRHGRHGFKLGIDGSEDIARDAAVWRFTDRNPFHWFPGREVAPGVKHVLRVRVPWDSMQKGLPSAPAPTTSNRIGQHAVLKPPALLKAADVDIYISETGQSYWPNPGEVRRKNAGLMPLRNSVGQILTAVSNHASVFMDPVIREQDHLTRQYGSGRMTRALLFFVHSDGACWVHERIVPVAMLRSYGPDEFSRLTQIVPSRSSGP